MASEKSKKPLIALLTNNDDDIYCFRKELVEAFKDAGYDILISCPDGPKFELMKHIEFIHDDPDIDRRGTNAFNDLKLFFHYTKIFKKHRPDIILTYTAKPNVYGSMAARMLRIPYICNVTGFGSVLNQSGIMQKFIMWLFKIAYSKAACIMFQNETNMKMACETGLIKGKYRLIPGSGVDTERFPRQHYPDGGNGINGETVVFNYIGRILHDKGVDDYIEAAQIIKKTYPNTEFNLLGFIEPTESHYEEDLARLEREGIVLYRGSQKDVRPFIARSHATIHPSTYGEGMSNVLLETASSARPIITTDNPGCKETVKAEVSGFIYKGGNVDELVKRIKQFLAMPNEEREKMGVFGREYMEENFSRKFVIAAYTEEIKMILIDSENRDGRRNG